MLNRFKMREPSGAVVTVQIEANLVWKVWRDPASGWWVGACDPLRLTAEGETYGELMVDIDGVLQGLFRHLVIEDNVQEFLRATGWKQKLTLSKIPEQANLEDLRFDVPFEVQHDRPAVHA